MNDQGALPEGVDVALALRGAALPGQPAVALREALLRHWPWLEREPLAGVHPLKLAHAGDAAVALPQRLRLLLRLPRARVPEVLASAPQSLALDGANIELGPPQVREWLAHSTLYAYRVVAPRHDEALFMQQVQAGLADLGVAGELVCGKAGNLPVRGQNLTTYSLMVHGLRPGAALRLLAAGLGPERLLGCGLFVPHRSASAVGSA